MATDGYRVKVLNEVPATEGSPSKGPAYRNIVAKDGFPTLEGAATCWEIMVWAAKNHPKRNAFGVREMVDGKAGAFKWQTYEEVFEISKAVGSALRYVGVQPQGRVGIYGGNSPEWVETMEGCNSQSIYCVPLYDTLGAEAIEFIIKHAEVSIVFVQPTKLPALVSGLAACTEMVKTVVCMGEWDIANKAKVDGYGMKTYSWSEFLDLGKNNPVDPVPPKPEEICTIMYTSGTTGEPKGVLLPHKSICAVIAALKSFTNLHDCKLDHNDVYLSFLPLAHIYERSALEINIYNGSSTGFWQGDVKLLADDISELKPTYFNGVPRIFDRMYAGIKAKVDSSSFIAKFLFGFFYNRKVGGIRKGKAHNVAGPLADKIVFSKVKVRLGGRVKFIISGAAPLAPHVEEFLKVAMCAPVMQGYGLTETCAGGFIAVPNNIEQAGTVGPPLHCIEVRLESVPDMNYDALGTPSRGEICIKGASLFAGYYKRDDLTKEAMDDEGWFHTGDVGEWQPDGSMKIIDRKKNIFKLAQGEYVAVENLENVYGNCPVVDSVWVYGNSFEAVLVAVATPNQSSLEEWAQANNVTGTFEELCAKPEARKWVLDQLVAVGKKGKLKGFELIKAIHLDATPFDMERDLLTPTFKKKRPQLLKYYKSEVDAMYDALKAAEGAKKS